jgi:hypothetical protein
VIQDEAPAFIDTDDTPPIILGQGDYRTTPEPNALFSGCMLAGAAWIVVALALAAWRVLG